MEVEVVQGAHRVIKASGEIDYSNAKLLQDAITDAVRESPSGFVIDLSGVEYMDSAGVQAIIYAYQSVTRAGGVLALVNTHPNVIEILSIVSMDKLPKLFMCDSLESAEQALDNAQKGEPS